MSRTKMRILCKYGFNRHCHHMYIIITLVFHFLHQVGTSPSIFQRDQSLQDKVCLPILYDFGRVDRPTYCATLCEIRPDCFGFFHSATFRSCLGVNVIPTVGCTANSSYSFFKNTGKSTVAKTTTTTTTTTAATTTTIVTEPSTVLPPVITAAVTTTPSSVLYGGQCTKSSDCSLLPHTDCFTGICQCGPGYKLDSSATTCVTDCVSYGSTFIKYSGYILRLVSLNTYDGIPFSECLKLCVQNAKCRSVNFSNLGPRCTLKSGTFRDDSSAWSEQIGIDHYVRNCA